MLKCKDTKPCGPVYSIHLIDCIYYIVLHHKMPKPHRLSRQSQLQHFHKCSFLSWFDTENVFSVYKRAVGKGRDLLLNTEYIAINISNQNKITLCQLHLRMLNNFSKYGQCLTCINVFVLQMEPHRWHQAPQGKSIGQWTIIISVVYYRGSQTFLS